MPALASAVIVASRAAGGEVRGSRIFRSSVSSVVSEMYTATAWQPASSASKSRSRVTRLFLVTMVTGLRNSASTSRQRAGQLEPAFDRLVGVGHPAQGDDFRDPAGRGQLLRAGAWARPP